MKKMASLIMIISILLSCLPMHVFAANNNSSYFVTIGNQNLPFSDYPAGSYFTDNGKACTDHNSCDAGNWRNDTCNCKSTWNGVALLSTSCYGFANMVFYRLFGHTTYSNTSKVVSNISAGSNLYNLFSGGSIKPGAHIRTVSGHSMIFMGCDNSYVYTYEGNWGGPCRVSVVSRTWTEFSNYFSSGIAFIEMPNNYTGSSTSNQVPGKPILKNMKETYTDEEEVLFSWDKTANAISYNWYIDKYDASSAEYKRLGLEKNVESVCKNLPIGKYRVCVTAYSTTHYVDSEWIYFEVVSAYPGKVTLKNMKETYTDEEEVLFSWDKTANTTSYNWYIDKYDVSNAGYVRLGLEKNVESVRKILTIGKYRVCVTSYNTNHYMDSEWIYFEVVSAYPGKVILKNMKETYTDEEEILFSWDETANTTSYNWYIDKYDASSAGYKGDHYVRLGLEKNVKSVRKTLPTGKYRVCITSYNAKHYMDSEWIYFEVTDGKPFTKTVVTKNDYGYIVETAMYNLDTTCEVIVAGYKDNRFITLKPAMQNGQSADCTLVGDIDEIKVMVWDNMSSLKPLCDAVVIPEEEWIIE